MSVKNRNWSLSPFTMWRVFWGEPATGRLGGTTTARSIAPKAKHDGARIRDRDTELIYEAAIVREPSGPRLVALTILTTTEGQRITPETMRRVPVQRITEQVSLHLAEQEGSEMPVFTSKPHRGHQDGPTTEQVAEDVRTLGLTRRDLAAKYQVSVYTIDKRLRDARDRELIDPPTTGRGFRRQERSASDQRTEDPGTS